MTTDYMVFDDNDDEDVLNLLTEFPTEKRMNILRTMEDNGWETLGDLASKSGVATATASEALRKLEALGLLSDSDSPLNSLGEIYVDQVLEMYKKAEAMEHLAPFLQQVSSFGEIDFWEVVDLLDDAEVVHGRHGGETVAGSEMENRLESSTKINEFAHKLLGHQYVMVDQFESGNLKGEFVISPELANTLEDDSEEYLRKLERNGANFFELNRRGPDFTLSIFDDYVTLFGRGNDNVLVKSTDEQFREWAKNTYEQLKEESDEFEI